MRNAPDLWNSHRFRIGYSHSTMINVERMQRESSYISRWFESVCVPPKRSLKVV
jgi:hypothetical protein